VVGWQNPSCHHRRLGCAWLQGDAIFELTEPPDRGNGEINIVCMRRYGIQRAE
jgi:hypothetical protein